MAMNCSMHIHIIYNLIMLARPTLSYHIYANPLSYYDNAISFLCINCWILSLGFQTKSGGQGGRTCYHCRPYYRAGTASLFELHHL